MITKKQAIEIFGSVNELADACRVTAGAISQWPDDLPERLEDRVISAVFRKNKRRRYKEVVEADNENRPSKI